jgi:hypothetical protein
MAPPLYTKALSDVAVMTGRQVTGAVAVSGYIVAGGSVVLRKESR